MLSKINHEEFGSVTTIAYADSQGRAFAVIIDRLNGKAVGCIFDENREGVTFANKIIMDFKVVSETTFTGEASDIDIAEHLYTAAKL